MTQDSERTRLLVFAKAPRPGLAKTRLIPLLGAEGAAALQARLIERTLAIVRASAIGPVDLYGTPGDDAFLQQCATRFSANLLDQCEGDLGIRMHHALSEALHSTKAAILIGTDCAALEVRHLTAATEALREHHDAVFVPVADGGYVLIGVRRAEPRLFNGIMWGSHTVMRDTRQRMHDVGWSWVELDTLWDIDTPADYERLVALEATSGGTIQEV